MEEKVYSILIVDDSETDREVYKRYLKKDKSYQYEIIEAQTGEEALELMVNHNPDIFLIDFLLPDIDGLELIETIEKNQSNQNVIMLTGKGNEAIAMEAMKRNVYDYLIKGDIGGGSLINSVHQIINLIDAEREKYHKNVVNTLIVEDSLEDQETYRRFLKADKEFNFNIVCVATGEKALEVCREMPLGVIVLDLNLPDYNGVDLLKEFQSLIDVNQTLIIMVTTQGSEQQVVDAMKNGAKDYLLKQNIVPELFRRSIKNNLKQHYLKYELLKNQAQQELISNISLKIRESLDLSEMLNTSVEEVKKFLHCDRVIIYRFDSDYKGQIIAESRDDKYVSLLSLKISDTFFQGEGRNEYVESCRKQIIHNIDQANIDPCHYKMLEKYEVKSVIALPILLEKSKQVLWGLLIAHYCKNYHSWEQAEVFFLQELCSQLAIAIKQGLLVKELEEAREKAERASAVKSVFLANMSHEIRTPMNAILGMSELLSYSNLDSQQKDFVKTIQVSGKTLLNLINDILDLSKLEAEQIILDFHPFNLSEILKEVYNLFYLETEKKNLDLTLNLPDNIPNLLKGDSLRLKQVLTNLVNNAIKFTQKGEVILTLEKLSQNVSKFPDFANPICLKITIQDTGIGIKPEDQTKLFEPFSQVDISTTRNYGGTGLGLSICQQLVTLMGGEIGVTSIFNQGSTFWFTVVLDNLNSSLSPMKKEDKKPLLRKSSPQINFQETRILVAEDNRVNQQLIKYQIKKMGYQVCVVDNGEKVLEELEKKSYQLVLMDCQMPVLDGYDATRKIRQRDCWENVIIIGATAFAMKGDQQKCLEAGMNDYITKPFSLESLQTVLAKWLPN